MRSMKKGFSLIARGCVFLAVMAGVILILNSGMKLRHRDGMSGSYYSFPKDTFDVVFLGSSIMMYGVQPLEMYGEYGIAAYNLSTGNQSLGISYYLAKEVIARDHPSVIVLDCSRSIQAEEDTKIAYMHYVTDNMPLLSGNRIRMITELRERGEWNELLLPLVAYHSRWDELGKPDGRVRSKEGMYGSRSMASMNEVIPLQEPVRVENALSDSARTYLEKIVDLCDENNTSLVLVSLPLPGKNEFWGQEEYNLRWSASEEIAELAREKDVEYINYMTRAEEIGLDLETDFFDGEHMNRWGAEKFSRLLAKQIREKYGLPDRRGEGGAYDRIEKDYSRYPLYRMQSCLQNASSLHRIADTLAEDAHDKPVEDVLVLLALNGKVDTDHLGEASAARLQKCGIEADLHKWEENVWLAVIDDGRVVYQTSPEGTGGKPDAVEGDAGRLQYCVSSGRQNEETGEIEDAASIKVNRLEYTASEKGLYIVAMDKTSGEPLEICRIRMESDYLETVHLDQTEEQ